MKVNPLMWEFIEKSLKSTQNYHSRAFIQNELNEIVNDVYQLPVSRFPEKLSSLWTEGYVSWTYPCIWDLMTARGIKWEIPNKPQF